MTRSRAWRRSVVVGSAVAAMGLLAVPAASAATAKSPARRALPAATVTGTQTLLGSVAAIPGTKDAWTVGERCSYGDICATGGNSTYIDEWNGSAWVNLVSPAPFEPDLLNSVAASSSTNAWAVGSDSSNVLALQWNGKVWSKSTMPTIGDGVLSGVATTSADNTWAVGTFEPAATDKTLAMWWNGKTWARVVTPNPGSGGNLLNAIKAVSASDIWAVGESLKSSGPTSTLIVHWNGKTWATFKAPPLSTDDTALTAITASGPNDVWATGYEYDQASDQDNPIALYFNGSVWSQIRVPASSKSPEWFYGIAAASSSNVWAVGEGPCIGGSVACPSDSLAEHWNGKTWTSYAVTDFHNSADQNVLNSVAFVNGNPVAVGAYDTAMSNTAYHGVIAMWNGKTWVLH